MVFFFPIGWSNYTPYLAKEIIGNTIRQCSGESRVVDLNNEFFNELIKKPNKYMSKVNVGEISKQLDILVSTDSVEEFDVYLSAKGNLNQFLSKYSEVDRTIRVSLDGIVFVDVTDDIYAVSLDNIFDYAVNERATLLDKFYSDEFLAKYLEEDIVAFSVTSLHQLVTSIYLANIMKLNNREIKIVMGGNYLTRIFDQLVRDERIFGFTDVLIKGCGEEILPLVYENAKAAKGDFVDIPNIAYYDCDNKRVIQTHSEQRESMHLSAFGKENCNVSYFLPQRVVPMYITRGCAWKKCTFCSIPNASGRFRVRKLTEVISDIKQYVENGVSYFSFIDEALTPFLMRQLAEAIQKESLNVRWGALARFDDSLDMDTCQAIYASGCRRLQFGLESYNENVLLKMNKGIDFYSVERVINQCIQCGISVNLFCMIGFPGETEQEAKNTIDFVLNIVHDALYNHGVLVTADFSSFLLDVNSQLFYNQEKYGIVSEPIEGNLVSLYTKYSPVSFNKDEIVYEAEQRYSRIIYDYFGKGAVELEEPLYISEAYWFLKACQMDKDRQR